jgi:NAD(P)-dependent dehydrogenase (short-subunit alcohol dehydrogenase family)
MTQWTAQDMPDQTGRTVIITGANSGLGLESAMQLARKGAHLIMACRDLARSQSALDEVKAKVPDASLNLMQLDLGSLASVRTFAEAYRERYQTLDILLNNAGLMATPRRETQDGLEMQLGVNHLAHFALTAHLIDLLIATPGSRVVSVSSSANWYGTINFDDLMGKHTYSRYGAYGQSKLANVVFANELQRRLEQAGTSTISNSAHPGLVMTNLQSRAAHDSGSGWEKIVYGFLGSWMAHPVHSGVLPQLYAATAPQAEGGAFYGPGFLHLRGGPKRVKPNSAALDPAIGHRFWQASEELTGVTFNLPDQVNVAIS